MLSDRIFLILIFLIAIILSPQDTWGYKTGKTHPGLIEKVIEFHNTIQSTKVDPLAVNDMKWGSIHEDDVVNLIPRYLKHFFDPTTGKGLKGLWADSITWALSPELQLEFGDYSWPTAIDKAKNGYTDYSYIALGHILHLLHDLTVPAHVRDDAHILPDWYETWVEDNWDNACHINWGSINLTGENVPNFSSLSDCFRSVAEYANKYFITKDTVYSYSQPELRDDTKQKKTIIDCETGKVKKVWYYIGEDEDGQEYKIAAWGLLNYLFSVYSPHIPPPNSPGIYLDDECLKDYFNRLGKKAILYGAGLLKLFFDSLPDTSLPTTPTGLTATVISSTQINLSWDPSIDNIGVEGYKIYRDESYLKFVTTNSAPDTGLSPNIQYCYTVSAYDAAGNESGQSSQACAITQGQIATNKIAFSSNRDGNYEIYVMNVDGNNQTRLTYDDANDVNPIWSPDASKIVFASDRDGNLEIYVMNVDGTNQTRLTNNPASDFDASWSPDGSKIAFRTDRDGNEEIYVMNADGTNPANLTNLNCYGWCGYCPEGEPDWSPDGSKIVFSSWRGGYADIWVMNSDGSNSVQLTYGLWAGNPAWSPDGTKIAFSHQGMVVVMNADGTNKTVILNVGCCISPYVGSWSPDGSKMVIDSDLFDGNYEIYTINSDGTNRTRLTNNPAFDGMPYWSPMP